MPDGTATTSRRFFVWLAAIALVGLALRVAYALAHQNDLLTGDALFYQLQSKALAEGHGLIEGAFYYFQRGRVIDSAEHPPLFTTYLALAQLVGLDSALDLRLWCTLLGVPTVMLAGCSARELADERAGIAAAILAAAFPYFWMTDGLVMSEAITAPTVALTVWLGARLYRAPSPGRAAAFGAAAALATLARAELVLVIPLVLLPLVVRRAIGDGRFRLRVLLVGAATAALVLTPWVVRNLTTFEHPVLLSDGWDISAVGANCHSTYYGEYIGLIDQTCGKDLPDSGDQTVQFAAARRRGIDYARDHASRLPAVVLARVGRTFGFFNARQQVRFDEYFEQREQWISYAGLLTYYAALPFAVYGGVLLHRRRTSLVPLLAPVITVVIASAVTFGNTRLRIPADVSLLVAAAIGIGALVARRATRTPRSDARDPGATESPHPT